jgi:hypothetical protein
VTLSDWDIDYGYGRQGELFIVDLLTTLQVGTQVEVKRSRYGDAKVYVEYEQSPRRLKGRYEPSGIAVTQAMVWAFVADNWCLFVPTDHLKRVARLVLQQRPDMRRETLQSDCPTRGVLLETRWLTSRSEHKWELLTDD